MQNGTGTVLLISEKRGKKGEADHASNSDGFILQTPAAPHVIK